MIRPLALLTSLIALLAVAAPAEAAKSCTRDGAKLLDLALERGGSDNITVVTGKLKTQ